MSVIIVCGGRKFGDKAAVYGALDAVHALYPVRWLIEGGASGADSYGKQWACDRKVPFHTEPADWEFEGKRADMSAMERCSRFKLGRLLAAQSLSCQDNSMSVHMPSLFRNRMSALSSPSPVAKAPRTWSTRRRKPESRLLKLASGCRANSIRRRTSETA